jgi:hypothetical protein
MNGWSFALIQGILNMTGLNEALSCHTRPRSGGLSGDYYFPDDPYPGFQVTLLCFQ